MPSALDLATSFVPQLIIVLVGIVVAIRLRRGRAARLLLGAGCVVGIASLALYFASYTLIDTLSAMERAHQISSADSSRDQTVFFVAAAVVSALGTALILAAALLGAVQGRRSRERPR